MPTHAPRHLKLAAGIGRNSWSIGIHEHIEHVIHAMLDHVLLSGLNQAEKDSPQPQVLLAFGLMNLKFPPMRSF